MTALLLLLACGPRPAPSPAVEPPRAGTLTVLHTNDLHGRYEANTAEWREGRPRIGGFAALEARVRAIEAERGAESVVLLDAGDVQTGTPLSDLEVGGVAGGGMLQLMELTGHDAWVLGNHEFDKGFDRMAALVQASSVPVLGANVRAVDGPGTAAPGLREDVVLLAGELRVGVIGVLTEDMAGLTSPDTLARFRVEPAAATVAAAAARLDPTVDLVVVLSHIGVEADKALAAALGPDTPVDLIVGGHSHTRMEHPAQMGDVWIVQAGSYGRSLGVLDVDVDDRRIVTLAGGVEDLPEPSGVSAVSPAMAERLEALSGDIATWAEVEIGTCDAALTKAFGQPSPLGNWITDVLRQATGADMALYNSGGLRAELEAGTVTEGDVYAIFPFGNEVVTFQLTGAEVLALFAHDLEPPGQDDARPLQRSGVVVRGTALGVTVEVGGAPVDPARTYTVATNSWVQSQAAKYLQGGTIKELRYTGRTVREVAAEAVRAGPVRPPEDAVRVFPGP